MDAHDGPVRQVGGATPTTTRIGAAMLPLGVASIAVFEYFHPSREDPMDFPAVFREYADSRIWTTVHLGEYFGFLLLLGGLVALYYSLGEGTGLGAGLAPFGFAAAITTVASFTVLQAVDGITLKRAVDAWASAPAEQETAAFAAAEAIRWTEMGMNALSYFLAGLTLFLFGSAIALGSPYPRWVGLVAAVSGLALMYDGAAVVAYEGFVSDVVKPVGLLLLAVWAIAMAVLMWRHGGSDRGRGAASLEPPPSRVTRRSTDPR